MVKCAYDISTVALYFGAMDPPFNPPHMSAFTKKMNVSKQN